MKNHDDIARDVRAFIESGGRIEAVPVGASGEEFNPNRTKAEHMAEVKAATTRRYYQQKNAGAVAGEG